MNRIPVVRSKLTMPQLSDSVIISDRIKILINSTNNKNAIIITAPAGYGKTTLLIASASHLNVSNKKVCWYRIDQEDIDLSIYYTYLIEMLFPNNDPQWKQSRQMLDSFADYNSQYRYINALICQELWCYCSKNPETQMVIVFDDFQNVKDSSEICESLTYFISNLPDNCTILLSSREPVDIITEKQKLERSVLEITQSSLCFIEKELSNLLTKTYKVHADKNLKTKILNSTEGWIAGVIMICQILSDHSPADTNILLEKHWQKTKLFHYMTYEILRTIDTELMQFLVKVSVLHDFTVEEAELILENSLASHLIMQCESKGLFLQKIIGDNITYRFHTLFREALLQHQQDYLTAEEIKNLNIKAASYYIANKVFIRAIEHFIYCGDINSAVDLITKESVSLITFEAVEQLRQWFNLLPEEVIERNPNLLYIKSFTYHQGKSIQPIILMEKALAKYQEKNDIHMQIHALLMLSNYYIISNNTKRALNSIALGLTIVKPLKNSPGIGNDIYRLFLFLKTICQEKLSRALIFSRYLINCEMREDWKWLALMYSCSVNYHIGELDFAERSIIDCLNLNLVKRAEIFKGYTLIVYCSVLYLKNDIDTLASIEDKLSTIGEKYNFNFMLGFGKRASAYRKYALHDYESAIELLNLSSYCFEQYGNTAISSFNKLIKLLWLSHSGKPDETLVEAKKAFQILSTQHSGFCMYEIGLSVLGAIARECGEYKFAEDTLIASLKISDEKGLNQIFSGTCLHLANLYFNMEQREKAELYMKKAFDTASANNYTMFWDIHLSTLLEMCIYCINSEIHTEFALTILGKYFNQKAVEYVKRNIVTTDTKSIKDYAKKIFSTYGTSISDNLGCTIDVNLFGRFTIAINGNKISEEDWKTKKIKGILEYLLLHKDTIVTRDQLMEIFWPNSDKQSAAISLRAALYELKKVLVKYGITKDENFHFLHEKAGSLEIKSHKMLFVDVDEFLQLYNEYKNKILNKADKNHCLKILEKINSIYTNDLLTDEVYCDWTFLEREELKSIFLEIVTDLASLYIENNDTKKAESLLLKVLSIDPYNEESCNMLIKLYVNSNQRSRAVKLYTNFEKRMQDELNINPDSRLKDAIK